MWNFATLLPLIIGDMVAEDQPEWQCFLLLLQITKQCTAHVMPAAAADIITALVDQHHREFKCCYPDVPFTPKMHYMVHFAQQLQRCIYVASVYMYTKGIIIIDCCDRASCDYGCTININILLTGLDHSSQVGA